MKGKGRTRQCVRWDIVIGRFEEGCDGDRYYDEYLGEIDVMWGLRQLAHIERPILAYGVLLHLSHSIHAQPIIQINRIQKSNSITSNNSIHSHPNNSYPYPPLLSSHTARQFR